MDTQSIFRKFLYHHPASIIFDIGTRDGSDAYSFKKLCPNSKVFAFEANPDLNIPDQGLVEFHNMAISNFNGESEFTIMDPKLGCGSLRENDQKGSKVKVKVTTIDTFLESRKLEGSLAFWIDVEGCTKEVLDGALKALDTTTVIHAEVETKEIWKGQVTLKDIKAMLERHNFKLLCGSMNSDIKQGNVIFVKKDHKLKIKFSLWFTLQQIKAAIKSSFFK